MDTRPVQAGHRVRVPGFQLEGGRHVRHRHIRGQLGYPTDLEVALGAVELLCLVLYLLPRTAVAGVVLLTGYLGGAVAIFDPADFAAGPR